MRVRYSWQLFHRAFGRLFCRTQPCAPHKRYGKILLTFKSFGFYEEKQHYFIYKRCPSKVKDDVILFAESEGLGAHANAIRVRFQDGQDK